MSSNLRLERTGGWHHNRPPRPTSDTDWSNPCDRREIEIRACQVIEVANDKVQAIRHYFDLMTMMQQLGALSGV